MSRHFRAPHRPRPRGVSPWRSPRLHRAEKVEDLMRLPITSKPSSCRTAHSRSASEDEWGRHLSRSSRSSSEQGRPERRERKRESTPPKLVNFTFDDFTPVSHTTNSILFTSGHPYMAMSDQDRVRSAPCPHDPEQEEEIRKRRKREVEPCRVRTFLRPELLNKAGPAASFQDVCQSLSPFHS